MHARDLFGVVKRSIGMGFFAMSLLDLVGLTMRALGLPGHAEYSAAAILAALLSYLALSCIFLIAADAMVRIVYGRDPS